MRRANQCEITCEYCSAKFKSWVHNAKYCEECKQLGRYDKICKHCDIPFRTNRDSVKYCNNCFVHRAFLKGKKRPAHIVEKINLSRLKWTNSEEGKLFYNSLGKKNSTHLKQYFKTEEGRAQIKRVASIQSTLMKEKIRRGEFTPNITNSFTHWTAEIEYDGQIKKFRSSWEACFWLSNPHLEYETIRVELPDGGCVITDFVDTNTKIIYEIKPTSFWRKQQHKIDAIIEYCFQQNYKFIWINERNILNYVDKTKFVTDFNKKQLEVLLNGIKSYIN
jgi:hypothetical protein